MKNSATKCILIIANDIRLKMKHFLFILLIFFSTNLFGQNPTCGDLLQQYAIRLEQAVFEKAKNGQGQVICTANYKVKGSDAAKVEALLIKHYKMSKLKFTCCGWESSKPGSYQSGEYYLDISMYANGEKADTTGKPYIEKDRKKIEYFFIVVNLYSEI